MVLHQMHQRSRRVHLPLPLLPPSTHQIEYTLITLDDGQQRARLSLLGPTILRELQHPETADPENHPTKWRPEYGSYMIEGALTHLVV